MNTAARLTRIFHGVRALVDPTTIGDDRFVNSEVAQEREAHLAAYATRSATGGSRVYAEPLDLLRTPFEVDRFRIIECTAFRRLEGKTQVFVLGKNDHFRTRLTHTLEVAEIARTLAAELRANEPLAEAMALAHDLGHPPFGHAGEKALDEAMKAIGGFNHNAHSVRVVEFLEHPYPPFRGLNLTAATLAGLRSHVTRYDQPELATRSAKPVSRGAANAPSVESRIVSFADRIAYNLHDLEDALGAEIIEEHELKDATIWKHEFAAAIRAHGERPIHAVRRVVLEGMLNTFLSDARLQVHRESSGMDPPDPARSDWQTVKAGAAPSIVQSDPHQQWLNELEHFLCMRVYQHPYVVRTDRMGRETVLRVYDSYRKEPKRLPDRFRLRIDEQGMERVIGDYIAGMTDRFCERELVRITGSRA